MRLELRRKNMQRLRFRWLYNRLDGVVLLKLMETDGLFMTQYYHNTRCSFSCSAGILCECLILIQTFVVYELEPWALQFKAFLCTFILNSNLQQYIRYMRKFTGFTTVNNFIKIIYVNYLKKHVRLSQWLSPGITVGFFSGSHLF